MAILTLADRKAQPGYYPVESVKTSSDVPRISWDAGTASSNATFPPEIPDTAACWRPAALRSAKLHLLMGKPVMCKDATAHTAITALALQILLDGTLIVTKIEKAY